MPSERSLRAEPGLIFVSDDPQEVIGNVLTLLVDTPQMTPAEIDACLEPDGDGFSVPSLGGVARIEGADDLPGSWLDADGQPTVDVEAEELWILWREIRDRGFDEIAITGDELRDLVRRAREIWPVR